MVNSMEIEKCKMINNLLKDIIILYHAECPDGFGAAWVAHKKLGDEAEYIGVHHNSSVPEGLVDKEVYLIDFSYPEDTTKDLIAKNKRVTAIDHHATREGAVKLTTDYLYSNDHSGSVLAWMYFYPDKPVPKLLKYIEDRDLWRFSLGNTSALCLFIDTFEYDFSVWDKLAKNMEDGQYIASCIEKGEIILKHENRLINRMVEEGARLVEFEGYQPYCVNAPHFSASDIGTILIAKNPPIAIIWSEDKERVNVSLRSDGSIDVAKIAQKFGGGGHKAAAGFNFISKSQFPWKEVKSSK